MCSLWIWTKKQKGCKNGNPTMVTSRKLVRTSVNFSWYYYSDISNMSILLSWFDSTEESHVFLCHILRFLCFFTGKFYKVRTFLMILALYPTVTLSHLWFLISNSNARVIHTESSDFVKGNNFLRELFWKKKEKHFMMCQRHFSRSRFFWRHHLYVAAMQRMLEMGGEILR